MLYRHGKQRNGFSVWPMKKGKFVEKLRWDDKMILNSSDVDQKLKKLGIWEQKEQHLEQRQ